MPRPTPSLDWGAVSESTEVMLTVELDYVLEGILNYIKFSEDLIKGGGVEVWC